MTDSEGNHVKLFRKPRAPKFVKIDLRNVQYPDDSTDSLEQDTQDTQDDTITSDTNTPPSTDRELVASSYYLSTKVVNYDNRLTLPSLNSFKTYRDNKLVIISEEKNQDDRLTSSSSASLDDLTKRKDFSPDKNYYLKNYIHKKPALRTIKSESQRLSSIRSAQSALSVKSLVQPYKCSGPDPLPYRGIKLRHDDIEVKKAYYDNLSYDNRNLYSRKEADFILNDFLLNDSNQPDRFISTTISRAFISNYNYKQICNILSDRIQQMKKSNHVFIQTLVPDVEPIEGRRPLRQTMIEMACYLKNQLSEKTGAVLKTRFNPVSKWQRMNGAQTELVIYEDKSAAIKEEAQQNEDDQEIPIQLAIVDCLLRNGISLSLKAHFIDQLPDISALRNTLIDINLSFNNFKEFPKELLSMPQLEAIKLRSNPIKYVPDKLADLQNLKILTLSYCLLNRVPDCVFELENLVHLDLSYNRLDIIDDKIVQLRKLKTLNYEGNEIEFIPSCMLKMSKLEQIIVKNNYLHPLIWRKFMTNNAQSLFDLAATKFLKYFGENSPQFYKLSYEIQSSIKGNPMKCQCCDGKLFGEGLRMIRPCIKIFGVKYLPFLFFACSPECYNSFKKSN